MGLQEKPQRSQKPEEKTISDAHGPSYAQKGFVTSEGSPWTVITMIEDRDRQPERDRVLTIYIYICICMPRT